VNEMSKDLTSAERARWLAELSDTLVAAEEIASQLGLGRMHHADAVELLMRLAAARAQVTALRLGRPDGGFDDADPKWTNAPLWPEAPR